MPDDAAKRFGLDAAAAERAGLRGEKDEGIACPPWWLPPFMANHGQVHSGNQVLTHVDVDDGKPHRDFISHQPAELPKPADSPSHGETIGLWTSSALLCAFVFLLSVYAFNGKVPTPFLLCAACTLFPCCTQLFAHLLSPCILLLHLEPLRHPSTRSSALCTHRTGRVRRGLRR